MLLGCSDLFLLLPTLEVTGAAGEAHSQAPVVSGHTSLWPTRWLPWSIPTTSISCKRHHVTFSPLLPLACMRYPQPPIACRRSTWSPFAQSRGSSQFIACARGAPPLRALACKGSFLWWSAPPALTLPTMVLCFYWRPRPPPSFPLLWHSTPKPREHCTPPTAHCSLSYHAVPTQPLLVLSLELTSGAWVSAPSSCQALRLWCPGWWCPGWWCRWSTRLLLYLALFSPTTALFLSDFEVCQCQMISPLVRWLPMMWVPFSFHSSLSGMLVPSWFFFSLSLSFLLFYLLMSWVSCHKRFKFFCQHSVNDLWKSFHM